MDVIRKSKKMMKESDLVLLDEFAKLGELIITSDDGCKGYKGNVVSYLKEHNVDFDYGFYFFDSFVEPGEYLS